MTEIRERVAATPVSRRAGTRGEDALARSLTFADLQTIRFMRSPGDPFMDAA
jgi:hypothetical protein